jgi:hypothetical protein
MDADVEKAIKELETNVQEYSKFLKESIDQQLKDGFLDLETLMERVDEVERVGKSNAKYMRLVFRWSRQLVARLEAVEAKMGIEYETAEKILKGIEEEIENEGKEA